MSETPSVVTRVDVWTQGHLKKNGEPVNKAVDETLVDTNHRACPIILGASSEISNWAFDHSILN